MNYLKLACVLVFILLLGSYILLHNKLSKNEIVNIINSSKTGKNMRISSTVFENNKRIPSKYTCDGENISPELLISGVPSEAKSLALIMDDPDVPKTLRPDGMFVHWVMFNISPKTTNISENIGSIGSSGLNGRGNPVYTGPCPPDREHRYFFKLYALDTVLDLPSSTNKEGLLLAMEGHILEQSELVGLYERAQKK